MADLLPGDDIAPFSFLRGVELTPDDRFFLTDSGSGGGGGEGRLFEAVFPDLDVPDTGETGASGSRRFVELGEAELFFEGVRSPFEAWFWTPPG